MVTCKNCLYVEVCAEYAEGLFAARGLTISPDRLVQLLECDDCEHFADRSRFVEVPCAVGDTVYFDNVHIQSARVLAIYIDADGGMLDLEITAYSDNALGFEKFINKDYKFEDIGKHLFLKKEEAEQALKEREENDN